MRLRERRNQARCVICGDARRFNFLFLFVSGEWERGEIYVNVGRCGNYRSYALVWRVSVQYTMCGLVMFDLTLSMIF